MCKVFGIFTCVRTRPNLARGRVPRVCRGPPTAPSREVTVGSWWGWGGCVGVARGRGVACALLRAGLAPSRRRAPELASTLSISIEVAVALRGRREVAVSRWVGGASWVAVERPGGADAPVRAILCHFPTSRVPVRGCRAASRGH